MSSDRHRRIEEVFHEVSELGGAEREARLEALCGEDLDLRREVEALLRHDAEDPDLDRPWPVGTPPEGSETPIDDPLLGTSVGPYTIDERIAQGGMGVVYRARQKEPIERELALKLIHPGLITAEVVSRFDAERRLLARMQHPAIATIHDAGTAPDGRPYFAMEYVTGEPITRFADAERLDLRERLALFVEVCRAVEHAHQRGVVHRDLKPSNILVAPGDGRPAPKVIDFGIARLAGGDDPDAAVTRTGQFIGTPAYSSPEQLRGAGGGAGDVDTRSDIYSLGLVLHELLTGVGPYDEWVKEHGWAGLSRWFESSVHARASTRFTALAGEARERIAESRRTSVEGLARGLRGDLDAILSVALAVERDRRYPTATAFADDVERMLRDEPITARPPGWSYVAGKFVRRNRLAVLSGTSFLVLLVVSLAVILGLYRSSDRRLQRIVRLSDTKELADLRAGQSALVPIGPGITERCTTWLERADALVARLPQHEADLADLRLRSSAGAEGLPSEPDAALVVRLERERSLRDFLEDSVDDPTVPEGLRETMREELRSLAESIAELERHGEAARTYPFDSIDLRWQHDLLADLVGEVVEFSRPDRLEPGTLGEMRRRAALSTDLRRVTLEDAAAEWSAAIASIADPEECPLYGGLAIEPQLGLVPLARSPEGLWEFWVAGTGDRPEVLADGTVVPTPTSGIVLVLLPGGSFTMGCTDPLLGAEWTDGSEGLHCDAVDPGSAAETLGLRAGDLVTHVHETAVTKTAEFAAAQAELAAGDVLRVTILRDGAPIPLGWTLPQSYDPSATPWESPPTPVEIDPVFIGKYELSQGQWLTLTGEDPSQYGRFQDWGGRWHTLRHPVERVSWDDATAALGRYGLILPTEAAWEFAVRAGGDRIFGESDAIASLQDRANIADRHCLESGGDTSWKYELTVDDGYTKHAPIGTYEPNDFGVHDLQGNVWEWCIDAWGAYEHPREPGTGRTSLRTNRGRVLRGGSFALPSRPCRAAARTGAYRDTRNSDFGVRAARSLEGAWSRPDTTEDGSSR